MKAQVRPQRAQTAECVLGAAETARKWATSRRQSLMPYKTVAVTLRGFELSPEQVELIVGVKASELGIRGQPVRPEVKRC